MHFSLDFEVVHSHWKVGSQVRRKCSVELIINQIEIHKDNTNTQISDIVLHFLPCKIKVTPQICKETLNFVFFSFFAHQNRHA